MADRGELRGRSLRECLTSLSASELCLLMLWSFFAMLYKLSSWCFRGVDKVLGRRLEGSFPSENDASDGRALVLSSAGIPVAPCVTASCVAGEMCCAANPVARGVEVPWDCSYETMCLGAVIPVGGRRDRQKFYAVCKG
jgi:hypothetical protein